MLNKLIAARVAKQHFFCTVLLRNTSSILCRKVTLLPYRAAVRFAKQHDSARFFEF